MHEGTAVPVGVDAGGTKTVALAANDAARSEAGPGNPHAVGFDRALEHVTTAVRAALQQAGAERPSRLVVGMAGAGREEDRRTIAERLSGWLGIDAQDVEVLPDVALLLPAGGHRWGVALVAGTGSSAYGVAMDGRGRQAGGWGYLVGDEGSAYDVGRRALSVVARFHDGLLGAEAAHLTAAVLEALGVRSDRPRDLIPAIYQAPSPKEAIASLAPVVSRAAEGGDAMALEIFSRAADALADIARAVAHALDLPSGAPVVGAGGLFRSGAVLLEPLARALAERGLGAPTRLEAEPAVGALALALATKSPEVTPGRF